MEILFLLILGSAVVWVIQKSDVSSEQFEKLQKEYQNLLSTVGEHWKTITGLKKQISNLENGTLFDLRKRSPSSKTN